ncbi:MAG: zinc ribbon domain-containing protein [Erysipelotrichaceae bacterium]|nr:zinc ribbon domain-containing protein [Erysipelotrichaceae bacterium]
MSEIRCPYCFEKITTKTAHFECSNCGETLKMPFNVGRGALPKCPTCKGVGVRRIVLKCNNCEHELPNDLFQYKQYIPFSIVGLSGSGKTNYITTMIQELKTSRCGFDVSGMNSETNNRFKEEKKSIYDDLRPSESTNRGIIIPYQWRVRRNGGGASLDSYCMTIFDGAGEDQKQIMDSDEANYIATSKYIIFLIDPMSLSRVRHSVKDQKIIEWSSADNQEDNEDDDSINLAQDMATFIRQSKGIGVNKKISIPVAICFTKIDVILDQFGQAQITKPSPHAKARQFKTSDAKLVDEEIREYLEDIGEGPFLDAIENNFSHAQFFGVSSYGNVPLGHLQLNTVEPHRVLDPLMWIFAQEKMIGKG